jgi:large subunit ribosomal protein L24e
MPQELQNEYAPRPLQNSLTPPERNPRKLAWTKSFRRAHGKELELSVDSALVAARRNVPVRYNRELVATTVKAMARISEIRNKRERAFYKQRMAGNRARSLADDRKLVAENQHLLPPAERDNKPENALGEEMDVEENEDELDNVLGAGMEDDLGLMESEDDEDDSEEEEIKVATKTKPKSILKQRGKLRVDGGVEF